jgi:subtilisin family serine protease
VIDEYKKDPGVEYAEPVYIRKALGDFDAANIITAKTAAQSVSVVNDVYSDYQWGLYATNIMDVWDNVDLDKRNDIVVAVIDTGVDLDHPDLADNILRTNGEVVGYDFVNNDSIPDDDDGHGTHVAGIVAATANNGIGIAGAAYGVKIMPVKVLGANGEGTSAQLAEGIRYAVDNGAHIINLSLGGESAANIEQEAIAYALSKGVVIVAATGNESNHWIGSETGNLTYPPDDTQRYAKPVAYPAAYDGVIGVGAADWYDNDDDMVIELNELMIADFSNIGPEVDVVAPGVDIASSFMDNQYASESGTSQAAPFVSALAALLKAANKSLSYDEVQKILQESAIDLGDEGVDDYFGAGIINGYRAFNLPRLDLQVNADSQNNPGQVNISLTAYDYNGTVDQSVYGTASLVVEKYNLSNSTWSLISESPVTISSGQGSVSVNLTSAGQYRFYATDSSESTYIDSNISTYTYTVNSDSASGGGSSGGNGGGGGSGATSNDEQKITDTGVITIGKDEDGNSNATVEVDSDKLDAKLDSNDDIVVTINAKTDEAVDKLEIQISAGSLVKAADKNKTLKIESNNFTCEIQPGTFAISNTDEVVNLSVTELSSQEIEDEPDSKPVEANEASKVFDFNLSIGNKKITTFDKSIIITVKYDAAKVKDKNKLGVYYYNENSKQWEYVGGKVKEDGTIAFTVEHFSKYVVMEYNKTFNDTKEHWAKYDIEIMAAKHIAKGIDANNFAPDASITRAEFAALLTRVLNIKEAVAENKFADISDSSWYKDAVNKAYAANIINGMDDSHFAPNEKITREQMASMIMRAYAYQTGEKLENMRTTMEVRFTDEGNASTWARRNMILADAVGLMSGNPDGTFAPKHNATRAQAIVVIKRFTEKISR